MEQIDNENVNAEKRLSQVRRKIVVLSGKGGVGKSTVAVNLAMALALAGKRVGLLDVDIHGPSIPTMLGLERSRMVGSEEGLLPIELGDLKVVSIGFLLQNQDDAVIWRGPMKASVIKQFLHEVAWGELDYLIIDSPPGTGDELLSVCQLIENLDGAVVVTTPQRVAAVDVRKSITFCQHLHVPVLGVIENMSGFVCPKCGEVTPILRSGGGQHTADVMKVPFLGSIPMDPQIAEACDSGRAFINHYAKTPTAAVMRGIIDAIMATDKPGVDVEKDDAALLKIAVPLAQGKLAQHFGHCERFAILQIDSRGKEIIQREDVDAPPHEPGLLPPWLAERGVKVVIAGGMGQRAMGLFGNQGIKVLVGAPVDTPENLVASYLSDTLPLGTNVCDH